MWPIFEFPPTFTNPAGRYRFVDQEGPIPSELQDNNKPKGKEALEFGLLLCALYFILLILYLIQHCCYCISAEICFVAPKLDPCILITEFHRARLNEGAVVPSVDVMHFFSLTMHIYNYLQLIVTSQGTLVQAFYHLRLRVNQSILLQ